jgi:hypothetical protein
MPVQTCNNCQKPKEDREFPYKNTQKGVKGSICNVCKRIKIREHYINNIEYYVEKAKRNKVAGVERNKAIRDEYVDGSCCEQCGARGEKLMFVAKEPIKDAVSNLIQQPVGAEMLLDAMGKCELLCSSCTARRARDKKHSRKRL